MASASATNALDVGATRSSKRSAPVDGAGQHRVGGPQVLDGPGGVEAGLAVVVDVEEALGRRGGRSLDGQDPELGGDAALRREPAGLATRGHDPMARHDDGERVAPQGLPDGLGRAGRAELARRSRRRSASARPGSCGPPRRRAGGSWARRPCRARRPTGRRAGPRATTPSSRPRPAPPWAAAARRPRPSGGACGPSSPPAVPRAAARRRAPEGSTRHRSARSPSRRG